MIYTHSLLYGVSYLRNSSQASTLFSRGFPDYISLKMALILPWHKYYLSYKSHQCDWSYFTGHG